MKYIITILFAVFFLGVSLAQTSARQKKIDQVQALNSCVEFTNESIHGLLIVHRLLENFNQKLNRYVDLEGEPLNFYSNKDLPANIFEDPEQWFFEVSPAALYQKSNSLVRSRIPEPHKSKLTKEIDILWDISKNSNQIRFDLEKLLDRVAEDQSQLNAVYAKLEDGVKIYNQFLVVRNRLEQSLQETYQSLRLAGDHETLNLWHQYMVEVQSLAIEGARKLRFRRLENLSNHEKSLAAKKQSLIDLYDGEIKKILTSTQEKEVGFHHDRIIGQVDDYLKDYKEFASAPTTPARYSLYGDAYYYHNTRLLSETNRYGNGMVYEMNNITQYILPQALYLMEEPHILQIIYPEKLEEEEEELMVTEVQEAIPTELEDRELIMRKEKLDVDNEVLEIQIYDHQKLDRDIVSLNFNGVWILEEYTITDKPKRLKLKLNKEGVNYLILHANNVGVIPPNTMALRYFVDGKRHEVILNSDLDQSEIITLTQ